MSVSHLLNTVVDADPVNAHMAYGDMTEIRGLEQELGTDLLQEALPDLGSLNFYLQDEEEYLIIYLSLGISGDELAGKLSGLYLCLKPSTNCNYAPETCVVIGSTVAVKSQDQGKGREEGEEVRRE